MTIHIEELLGQYWDIAVSEGLTGVSHGDKANDVLHQIRQDIAALPPAQLESKDAELFRECLDLSFAESNKNGEFVGVMLPRPLGIFKSTADEFRAAIAASKSNGSE